MSESDRFERRQRLELAKRELEWAERSAQQVWREHGSGEPPAFESIQQQRARIEEKLVALRAEEAKERRGRWWQSWLTGLLVLLPLVAVGLLAWFLVDRMTRLDTSVEALRQGQATLVAQRPDTGAMVTAPEEAPTATPATEEATADQTPTPPSEITETVDRDVTATAVSVTETAVARASTHTVLVQNATAQSQMRTAVAATKMARAVTQTAEAGAIQTAEAVPTVAPMITLQTDLAGPLFDIPPLEGQVTDGWQGTLEGDQLRLTNSADGSQTFLVAVLVGGQPQAGTMAWDDTAKTLTWTPDPAVPPLLPASHELDFEQQDGDGSSSLLIDGPRPFQVASAPFTAIVTAKADEEYYLRSAPIADKNYVLPTQEVADPEVTGQAIDVLARTSDGSVTFFQVRQQRTRNIYWMKFDASNPSASGLEGITKDAVNNLQEIPNPSQ